jgi:uncharacterized membrane protein YqjE
MAGDDVALQIAQEFCSDGGQWRDRRSAVDRLGALQQWQATTWQTSHYRSPESSIVMACKRFYLFILLFACLALTFAPFLLFTCGLLILDSFWALRFLLHFCTHFSLSSLLQVFLPKSLLRIQAQLIKFH